MNLCNHSIYTGNSKSCLLIKKGGERIIEAVGLGLRWENPRTMAVEEGTHFVSRMQLPG